MLSDIPAQDDPRILADFRNSDDAGVYRWDGGSALVQTVDFFTPIVDDPFVYGEIAAANALSDVYAMGGRPLTALAIAGFPKEGLEPDVIRQVFRGGFETLRRAGVALLGGHTVQDAEIKFGYAVTGAIDPARILTNAGARPGDALFLTKPIGTGVIATALKFGRVAVADVAPAIDAMRALNGPAAAAIATIPGVHACTDITGFGLFGHGSEMAAASQATLVITASAVPLLPRAHDLAHGNRSGGLLTNREHFGAGVRAGTGVDPVMVELGYDPQTSGGLLVAVAPDQAAALAEALTRAGVAAARIGVVAAAGDARIRLE